MATLAETLERVYRPDQPARPDRPRDLDGGWEDVEDFLAARGATRRSSENTLSAYRNDLRQLRRFLDGHGDGVAGWDVEPVVILEFVAWLKDQEFAPASQARKLAATRAFYAYLHESGRLPTNPAAHIGSPRVGRHAPSVLTEAEIEALLLAPSQRHTPEGAARPGHVRPPLRHRDARLGDDGPRPDPPRPRSPHRSLYRAPGPGARHHLRRRRRRGPRRLPRRRPAQRSPAAKTSPPSSSTTGATASPARASG